MSESHTNILGKIIQTLVPPFDHFDLIKPWNQYSSGLHQSKITNDEKPDIKPKTL